VSSREGIEAAKVKGTERRRKGNNMKGGKGIWRRQEQG